MLALVTCLWSLSATVSGSRSLVHMWLICVYSVRSRRTLRSAAIHPFTIHHPPIIHTIIQTCMHNSLAAGGFYAPLQLMAPSFLTLQSDCLQILFLSPWLDVRSHTNLDVIVSIHLIQRVCSEILILRDNFGRLQLIKWPFWIACN
jgi:hypothetical protein